MKYALREGRRSLPPQEVGGSPKRVVQDRPAAPAEVPVEELDARLLASALDQLAREVLVDHRPLHEAWEHLRGQLLSGRTSRRRLTAEPTGSPRVVGCLNCWEHTSCGREPGGRRVAELGVCPASVAAEADGVNGGRNGGRICWIVAGTGRQGPPSGTLARGHDTCSRCTFYRSIHDEADSTGDPGAAPR